MNQNFIDSLTTTLNGLIQSLQILSQELFKQSQVITQLENQQKELEEKQAIHQKNVVIFENHKQQLESEKLYLDKRTAEMRKIEESANKAKSEAEGKLKLTIEAEETLKIKQLEIEKEIIKLDDLKVKEQDLIKREELIKKEIAIDRDRKELLQAREKNIEQRETRQQKLATA